MAHSKVVPTIAAIGTLSWDEVIVLDRYPSEGGYSLIHRTLSMPGGTTGNIAMAAQQLGADVSIFAKVGDDQRGAEIVQSLRAAGIHTDGCLMGIGATDTSMVLISKETAERTILWNQGPHIQRRDRINVDRLFAANVTVIDCLDFDLRKFLTDLPAHTRPGACLIGTLTYIADVVARDKLEIALRHDVLIGNEREYCSLVGLDTAEACLEAVGSAMTGHNLRTAIMTKGRRGAQAISQGERITAPARDVAAIDSTGAGDAFAGAFAFAQASRWPLERSLIFANTVAGSVVSSLGAQSGLPTYEEAMRAAGFES